MRILVTGGAGFIGSAVIRHIIENTHHHVLNVDKLTYAGNLESLQSIEQSERYQFFQTDICDQVELEKIFENFQPNVVMHLAAESHVDRSIDGPAAFIQTNIVGTYSLLEAARKYWLSLTLDAKEAFRFHHISTDEVYGDLEGTTDLFTETTPYTPSSPYSASKASSDHLVRAWYRTYGLPVLVTNCSNNYGPNHFPEKLIPLFIHNIIANKPLPVYGDGNYTRDWLFVEDHARAIDTIFHNGKQGQSYNVGGFNEWKNIDLVHLLCSIMDKKLGRAEGESAKLITYVKDRAGHDLRYAIDATKLNKDLGWKPSVTFEEGLAKTIDWFLENEEWLNNVTSGDYQKYYEKQYS